MNVLLGGQMRGQRWVNCPTHDVRFIQIPVNLQTETATICSLQTEADKNKHSLY